MEGAKVEAVFELVLIFTGKGVVWLLSFGRWRGESLSTNEASIHSAAGSLSFVLHGRRIITVAGLTLIGAAFYVMFFPILFFCLSSF
jgi:hypothetical protein